MVIEQRRQTHPRDLLDQQRNVIAALRDEVGYLVHPQSLAQSGIYLQIWANRAFKVVYFIFDGELGHNDAMPMVSQVGLHLVSKLRYNSALYFPYDGPYCGRGPRRKYGQKVDDRKMPSASLKSTSIDQEIKTQMYQLSLWH